MKKYLTMTREEVFEHLFDFVNEQVPWLLTEWLDEMEIPVEEEE